jgi:hypothetical protein
VGVEKPKKILVKIFSYKLDFLIRFIKEIQISTKSTWNQSAYCKIYRRGTQPEKMINLKKSLIPHHLVTLYLLFPQLFAQRIIWHQQI